MSRREPRPRERRRSTSTRARRSRTGNATGGTGSATSPISARPSRSWVSVSRTRSPSKLCVPAPGRQHPDEHTAKETHMKAVRFENYGDIDVLNVVEVPDPVPGQGQVLVRVKSAGIGP